MTTLRNRILAGALALALTVGFGLGTVLDVGSTSPTDELAQQVLDAQEARADAAAKVNDALR